MNAPKTIVYFRNGLGNLLQMTPAMRALAAMDETRRVDVCLDSEWKDKRVTAVVELLGAMPFVNAIVRYPEQSLDVQRYRCWFHTPHSEPSQAYQTFQAMSKRLISRVSWDKLFMREVDYYMEAVRRLGFRGEAPPLFCPVGGAVCAQWPRPWIGLCNGGFGDIANVKRWPYFAELGAALQMYFNATVICFGWKGELPEIPGAIDFTDRPSILETTAAIKACDLFITTDTGLMHAADALRVPSIILWGGTLVSKNGPTNVRSVVLRAGMHCQPCQYTAQFPKCKDVRCLKALSVGEVMRHVRDFL